MDLYEGMLLCAGCEDATVRLQKVVVSRPGGGDGHPGGKTRVLKGHTAAVAIICQLQAPGLVALGSLDCTVRLWQKRPHHLFESLT